MENITRSVLFNDLPEDAKQRVLRIRNLGDIQPMVIPPLDIPSFDDIVIPSISYLHKPLSEINLGLKNLFPHDISEILNSEIKEFNIFVSLYRSSVYEKDIIKEFETTASLLELDYEKLLKERFIPK